MNPYLKNLTEDEKRIVEYEYRRSIINENATPLEREFHSEEIEDLKAVAHGLKSIDDLSNPLRHRLFNHYEHEMPYGIAKARTGDPYDWISDKLSSEFSIDESAPFGEDNDNLPDLNDHFDDHFSELTDEEFNPNMEEDAVVSIQTDTDADLLDVLRQLSGLETKPIEPIARATDIPPVYTDDDCCNKHDLSIVPDGGTKITPSTNEYEFSVEDKLGEAIRRPGRNHDNGKDSHYDNEPDEATLGVDSIVNTGTDLNRKKHQWRKEYPGDNSMDRVIEIEESLWRKYSKMKNELTESLILEDAYKQEKLRNAIESGETPDIINASFSTKGPAWSDLKELGWAKKLKGKGQYGSVSESWQYVGPGTISVNGRVFQKGDKTDPIEVDYE